MASQEALDRVGMSSARLWSSLATCSRLSVGCVIADRRGRLVSSGYNGVPAGEIHCWHPNDNPCTRAVHSEDNAIRYATESVEGYTMYCTHSPCANCAGLIVSAGIVRVVYGIPYRNTGPLDYLNYSGVNVEQYRGE